MSVPGDPRAQRRPIASFQQAACLAASSLIALLALDAFAQEQPTAPRWPTSQEIERAKAEHPLPAPDAPIPAPRALPRIGPGTGEGPGAAQRPPASGGGIDIGALARQGSRIGGAMNPGALPPQEPALRVFVTLDLPRAACAVLSTRPSGPARCRWRSEEGSGTGLSVEDTYSMIRTTGVKAAIAAEGSLMLNGSARPQAAARFGPPCGKSRLGAAVRV